MADFLQNLDPASYDPNAAFSLNPLSRPLVNHPDPAATDAALQRASELGMQVALPLGLGAIGGPMSLGWRALGPAITQAILGPLTPPRTDGLMMGVASPNPEQAELTAAQVLAQAASKGGPSYAQWQVQNPGAEEGMFDFKNAQPAMQDRAPVPRYAPPPGTSDRLNDAMKDPQVAKALQAAVRRVSWICRIAGTAPARSTTSSCRSWATRPRRLTSGSCRWWPQPARVAGCRITSAPPATTITWTRPASRILDKPAPGYGSVAQKLHRQNVINVQNGGMNPLQNPKPTSFVENLLGNETPVTIDNHNFRMLGKASKDPRFLATSTPEGDFNPRKAYQEGKLTIDEALNHPVFWDSAPQKNEYGAYEAYQQQQAKKMGLTPAEWQEKMWVGGEETGLGSDKETFLRTVAKRVQYTAAKLGADPQVVLQKFVRGEIPLLSVGAGGVALGGLSPNTGQPKAQRR